MYNKNNSNLVNSNRILTYLNISGISNIYKQDVLEGLDLFSSSFIGVVETWSEKDNFCSSVFKNFYCISSPAVRINVKGRASGGLMLMSSKSYVEDIETLHIDKFTIIIKCKLKYSNAKVIIVLVYYPPSLSISCVLECLETLEDILDPYEKEKIVILGDFNARVGDCDCNSLLALNLCLSEKRNSNDKFITSRGKRIVEFCSRNQLTILNGRTNSDIDGEYTFVDTIGSSVTDYAMVNQSASSCIKDMKVCHVSHSPHCALQINL